jgi:hypothetical protein
MQACVLGGLERAAGGCKTIFQRVTEIVLILAKSRILKRLREGAGDLLEEMIRFRGRSASDTTFLFKCLEMPGLTPLLHGLIAESSLPLRSAEADPVEAYAWV